MSDYRNIFIPFLGPSNAGKSTIINGIIGTNILPTGLNECTKRGIIIRYRDHGQEDMTISKSTFVDKNNDNNYIFNEGDIIGQGINGVTTILKGLNYKITEKEEDSFYFIKTKIKLFDDLGLNDSLKRMIYLIDIPGYGTNNMFMKTKVFQNLIKISTSFVFVLRNSIIKENNTKEILDKIFEQTTHQKYKVFSGIIKSCNFILNNDNSKNIKESDVIKAKKDILQIISKENDKYDLNSINLCYFNAKYFCDYCNDYNYFFNLEETFENEYNNYIENKINNFKWPELKNKEYKTFFEFLNNQLNDKLKKKFKTNIKKIKTQINNENVKYGMNNIFTKLNVKMEELLKEGDKIVKIFSYAQEKIKELSNFKESNIESLNNLLNSQFNYIYKNKKESLQNMLGKASTTLDEFFQNDFSQMKIEEIDVFNKKMDDIKEQILNILKDNKDKFNKIFMAYKKKIKFILDDKKDNINNTLKDNSFKKILNEIDNEMKNEYNNLNEQIKGIINDFNQKIVDLFEERNKEINKLSKGKITIKLTRNFKEFLLHEIGDKNNSNLNEQLFVEVKNINSLSKISETKGFADFIKSAFSSYHYLLNNIEIILADFISKVDYLLVLLTINIEKYTEKILAIINKANDMVNISFTKKQLVIWNEIKSFYFSIKDKIEQTKNEIIKMEY